MASKIKNPCIGKCVIKRGVCNSCKRTRSEVGGWNRLSGDDKQAILDRIESSFPIMTTDD